MKYTLIVLAIVVIGVMIYAYTNQSGTLSHLRTKSYLNPKTYILNLKGVPPEKIMDHDSALAYMRAWKEYEHVSDTDFSIISDTPSKIRGDVGSLEFEYDDAEHVLITRTLLTKDIDTANPNIKAKLIEHLTLAVNGKLGDIVLEDDSTAGILKYTNGESQSKYPERLNLRLDFKDASMSSKTVVDILDNFSSLGYEFKNTVFEKTLRDIADRE